MRCRTTLLIQRGTNVSQFPTENGYGERSRHLHRFGDSTWRRKWQRSAIPPIPMTTSFAKELTDKIRRNASELYELRESARERGLDPRQVTLPPLVSFADIFIPDKSQKIGSTSSLAYNTRWCLQETCRRRAGPTAGPECVDHPQLVLNGGKYVQDSIFVDAFWAQADDDEVKEFNNIFNGLKRAPRVIDALTWDATRLLTAAVLKVVMTEMPFSKP